MAIDITKVLNVIQEKIGSANTSVSTREMFFLTKAAKAAGSGSVIESYANSDVFPTANNTVKKLAFDELNRTLYMNSDGTWAALDITVPDAVAGASGYSFQGSNYGYASGGRYPYGPSYSIPEFTNIIDKFPFSSDANATDVGDLTVSRYAVAGQSSANYGYTSGGGPGYYNTIDKFSFSTDGNATDVGDLTLARSEMAGQSSSESGYTSGGGWPHTPTVDKFPFATDANATDVGDLTQSRYLTAGQSSSESGYTSGGRSVDVSPNNVNTIDKFPFATDANATDVGDLTVARWSSAGQSSSESGYTSGGTGTPTASNVIDKFPFASDANATDVGDLIATIYEAAGQSSTDYGYTTGGRSDPAALDTIQKFSFTSDGNATDVANLTVPRMAPAGQQY